MLVYLTVAVFEMPYYHTTLTISAACSMLGGPWSMKAAIYSRPSAVSLKVWLRETRDMLVINASNHSGNPKGNSDYWVTSRGHRKTLSSERHLSD